MVAKPRPWTRPASSSSAADDASMPAPVTPRTTIPAAPPTTAGGIEPTTEPGGPEPTPDGKPDPGEDRAPTPIDWPSPPDVGNGPPAMRSAALPARPAPSVARRARNSGVLASSVPRPLLPAAPAPIALVAHGGGAAQSRGGLRWASASSTGDPGGPGRALSFASGGPCCVATKAAEAVASAAGRSSAADADATAADADASTAGRSSAPRACAASRRAQSWNVGQTGNALDRQYASWCARARGPGVASAKHRCRWSGLVARASRSSSNATNGQADAPSTLGNPRSVIVRMILGRGVRERCLFAIA